MSQFSISPLPDALLRAQAYPHAIDMPDGQVQLVETHISWVFLTGPYAYKVKKPACLGFIDFRELSQRRHFCHEEVRLNQRTAADWYCGVVPIERLHEELIVGDAYDGLPEMEADHAEPSVVEYAVKMRQFPSGATLDQLATAGELTVSQCRQIGEQLGCLHERAERLERQSPLAVSQLGTRTQVEAMMAENTAELLSQLTPDDKQLRGKVEEQSRWIQAEIGRCAAVIDHRRQTGCLRECHGDAHLGNLFWHADQVVMFDALEFNPEFRWGDIAGELAFTLMDLNFYGLTEHAHATRDAWLEKTGDFQALQVLPLYFSYRALVRAKVALIRRQQTSSPRSRDQWLDDAVRHIELSHADRRPNSPALIITFGLSGSGKSTGTQQLVQQCGVVRVRSDVERKRLFDEDVDQHLYGEEMSEKTYRRLEEVAKEVIAAGETMVVDATFLRRKDRDRFHQLADRLGVSFRILAFEEPVKTLRHRVEQRALAGNDPSDADMNVLEQQLRSHDSLTTAERSIQWTLDTALQQLAPQC